jgi:hypothetical protein
MHPSDASFLICRATVEDAAVVARHRARMFHDMGEISGETYDDFLAASQEWTKPGLTSGEYMRFGDEL